MKTVKREIVTTVYQWDCPRCGQPVESETEPMTEAGKYCFLCRMALDNERAADAKRALQHLVGARIVEVVSYDLRAAVPRIDRIVVANADGRYVLQPTSDGWDEENVYIEARKSTKKTND